MISYSTNWMGPINLHWYEENGLLEADGVTPTIRYSAGRMDIRDDSKEGYAGWHEYSLAPMRSEDWNLFSTWLDDLETETLWTLDQILEEYRQDTGHVIRWWKEENDS